MGDALVQKKAPIGAMKQRRSSWRSPVLLCSRHDSMSPSCRPNLSGRSSVPKKKRVLAIDGTLLVWLQKGTDTNELIVTHRCVSSFHAGFLHSSGRDACKPAVGDLHRQIVTAFFGEVACRMPPISPPCLFSCQGVATARPHQRCWSIWLNETFPLLLVHKKYSKTEQPRETEIIFKQRAYWRSRHTGSGRAWLR